VSSQALAHSTVDRNPAQRGYWRKEQGAGDWSWSAPEIVRKRAALSLTVAIHPVLSGILTIKEVAEYLKVMERTIYRLAAAKKIPAFKVGGTWRFLAMDIDGWIADQSKKAEGAD